MNVGNAFARQVVATHSTFGISRIPSHAAGRNDGRSEFLPIQSVAVVQSRAKYWRRSPCIFRRAEHDDHVSKTSFVACRLPPHSRKRIDVHHGKHTNAAQ